MSVVIAARRRLGSPVLLTAGAILFGGGIIAAVIVRVVMTLQTDFGPLQELPEGAYAGYSSPPANPDALDNTLTAVFLGVAAVGLLVLAVAVVLPRVRSVAVWLLVPGALMAIGGAIGGVVANQSAEIAAYLASQPKALLSNDLSNSLALNFDPSSAHFVPPSHTGLWLGFSIAAVGVLLLLAGAIVATSKKRLAPPKAIDS